MASEPKELNRDNQDENPFAPTSVPLLTYAPLFSTTYWLAAWLFFATSVVLLFASLFLLPSLFFIALLWMVSAAMALYRSLWASRRVRTLKLEYDRKRIQGAPVTFYVSSLVFGALSSIASAIAFVCVCFPGGRILVGASGQYNLISWVCLFCVSTVAGLLVGYFCLSATVPRRNLHSKNVISDSDPFESER